MAHEGLLDGTAAIPLRTDRLALEPLRAEHAEEMAPVLGDPGLHRFTGGRPATLPELRARYEAQASGASPDGSQGWLNWVVRLLADGEPVGYVQATVRRRGDQQEAEVAWVIGARHQGRGYATEAATAMVDWLRAQRVGVVTAHVHPEHRASAAVAAAVGLSRTDQVVDGEVRWES